MSHHKASAEYSHNDLIHHKKYHSDTLTFAQEQKITKFKGKDGHTIHGIKGGYGESIEDDVDHQMEDLFHLPTKQAVAKMTTPNVTACLKLFDEFDFNGNGILSLAEIDKVICDKYPPLNHKPALIRAYYASDKNKSGFISKHEFRTMIANVIYFNQVWEKFEEIDSDHDRRLSRDEWLQGCSVVGVNSTRSEAGAKYDEIDENNGGTVLFKEFCI
eukprot:gene17787-21184_t